MAYVLGARMALLSVLKVSGSCEGNLDLNAPAPDGGSSMHHPSTDAALGDAAAEDDDGSDASADGNRGVLAEATTSVDDAASFDSGVPVASDL